MVKGFFAYCSKPETREIITAACQNINQKGTYSIKTWEELRIAGKYVIDEICNAIDNSDVFIADLTYFNHNVLFELGYAIGKEKRILIFLDTSVKNSKQSYDRLNLSTIGYLPFESSEDIVSRFLAENIGESLKDTLTIRIYKNYPKLPRDEKGILYLKNIHTNDYSIKISNQVSKSKIKPLVIDDPTETYNNNLDWYIRYSLQAYAVVGHLSDINRESAEFHNAKVSLCAGIGYGFGKKVLLVANDSFESALDYKHLLLKAKSFTDCDRSVGRWLNEIASVYDFSNTDRDYSVVEESNRLAHVELGDFIAEQETKTLLEYYVPLINMKDILSNDCSLIIGRKGTGKSALLYKIEYDLITSSKKNHVCVIKPIAYELGGLLVILRSIVEESEKSYLMESLWKFLIYTELAKSITEEIKNKPGYIDLKKEERSLLEFVEKNEGIILQDFWVRFDGVITSCQKLPDFKTEGKLKISEFLHDTMLSRLKSLLVNLVDTSYEKLVVLIDNLDKTWQIGDETGLLSSFLFGLISVSGRIMHELSPRRSDIQFSLLVFLRSDIFAYIYKTARERDKLKYHQIIWDDAQILLKIIDKRLEYNFQELTCNKIWDLYFCKVVHDVPIKDFIIENIIPRPRDIVYLVLMALRITIARGHEKIEESDLLGALDRYSQYALDSLLVESEIDVNDFERLLYAFVGETVVISENKLKEIIKSELNDRYEYDDIVDMLCEKSFLGRQVKENEFRYQYGYEDAVSKALAKTFTEKTGKEEFEINIPYRRYLEIT